MAGQLNPLHTTPPGVLTSFLPNAHASFQCIVFNLVKKYHEYQQKSSAVVKYWAMTAATNEVVWLSSCLSTFGINLTTAMPLHYKINKVIQTRLPRGKDLSKNKEIQFAIQVLDPTLQNPGNHTIKPYESRTMEVRNQLF